MQNRRKSLCFLFPAVGAERETKSTPISVFRPLDGYRFSRL